ncbi:MAG: MarR family transcriptional regulator [Legionellales bacterium]|nr:MarR family transcriptional regulator [Legionellales bacterium]
MTRYKNLLLNHQLCFALYAATNSIIRTYRKRLSTVGLTYPQYLVMLVLWEKDGLSINQLAQKLKLDAPTISPILKRLQSYKLIKKERDKSDERRTFIYLTKDGLGLENSVADLQKQVACKTGLNDKEFYELRDTLNQLTETLSLPDETKKSA